MGNVTLSTLTFALLSSVAILCMYLHPRLAEHHRDSETAAAVSKIANIFVVITSLVFGLLITSSKTTFESVDRNIHIYATELVLLDRLLRNYGSDASNARAALKAYVEEAIAHPAQTDELAHIKEDTAGHALDLVGMAIDQIQPVDSFHERLFANAQSYYREVVRQRWVIVEQSEGVIPKPIICMLIAWLTLIFASFGYRAPKNAVVISMVLLSAMLISASLYLILDMDIPFRGPIRISYEPYSRALNEMREP